MSIGVPSTEQGLLQGALTSSNTLIAAIAPLVANTLFSFFVGPGSPLVLPGAPFFIGSLMFVAAVVLAQRQSRLLGSAPYSAGLRISFYAHDRVLLYGAMGKTDLAIGIGGAAGQGIATPGDILARIFVRRGLHVNAYNAYQSIIRGGHIFLTLRTSDQPVLSHGDKLDVLVPLNQDTMDRHLRLMGAGSAVLYNADTHQARRAGRRRAALPLLGQGAGARRQGRSRAEHHRAWPRSCG